jgi:hypothetical protein
MCAASVNIASALLLGGEAHDHAHGQHVHVHHHDDGVGHRIQTSRGTLMLEIFEAGVPPRFRLSSISGTFPNANKVTIETLRPAGARQVFTMAIAVAISNRPIRFRSRMRLRQLLA